MAEGRARGCERSTRYNFAGNALTQSLTIKIENDDEDDRPQH